MLMLHPFLSLVGYTRFSVSEEQAARFIELCSALGIFCRSEGYKSSPDGVNRAFFVCSALSRQNLFFAAKRYGITLHDRVEHGLPLFIRSHFFSAKRLGLTLGFICACLMIFFSGRVLWDIRIVGNQRLSQSEVMALLEKNGICIGMKKSDVETSVIENRVLMSSSDVAWLSINIRGTVATVEIKEAHPSVDGSKLTASNLVSNANGTVERIEEIHGNLSVALGDAVSEGQLLVGGIYDSSAFSGLRYTRARGKIFARCEKDIHVEIPLTYTKKVYTGAKKVQKSLIFFKKEVNFFGNSRNSYASCDKINTERYFNFFGLGDLPFGVRTTTYLEYETESAERDIEIAMEQALFELSEQISRSSPECELLRKQISTEISDTALILDCHIVCVQNIAVEKEIEINILK